MKPPIITLSPVCTKLRALMLPSIELVSGLRPYTSTRATPVMLFTPRTDRRVVARWQIRDDSRLKGVARSVAAGLNFVDLITGDNPTDDRAYPGVIRGNQSSRAVVQFQGRVSQCLGNAILRELRAYGANNYPLWLGPLNHEAANHHVVACLNKGPRGDVSES